MNVYFYFDDSGKLAKGEELFLYSGFCIFGDKQLKEAEKRFKFFLKKMKINNNFPIERELKGKDLKSLEQKEIINNWFLKRKIRNLSILVKNSELYEEIISDNKRRVNYKEYILKMGIRNFLEKLMNSNQIKIEDVNEIKVFIDRQEINSFSSLSQTLETEINSGFFNYYNKSHFSNRPPLNQNGFTKVSVNYVDSHEHLIIQAADFLANYKRSIYNQRSLNYKNKFNENNKCYKFPVNFTWNFK